MRFKETAEDAWALRYGAPAPFNLDGLDPFLRHRSVRRFSDDPISESTVAGLIGAAQSASTSSSLQMWSVVSVEDPARRLRMADLCDGQTQVQTAPWFLAFCADHYRLAQAARAAGVEPQGLDYFEFGVMALIDVALAAERFACAAESNGYGICYIGALRNDPKGVQELLDLPTGTFGTFGMCLGVPSDEERGRIKPRIGQSSVWFRETYDKSVSVAEYDERMRPAYERRGLVTTWSKHSGVRVNGQHMAGREVLREFLQEQGFFRR